MQNSIIFRKCIVTKKSVCREELIRINISKSGKLTIDKKNNGTGRGIYLKRDTKLILKAKNKNLLAKILKQEVIIELYDDLIKIIDEQNKNL